MFVLYNKIKNKRSKPSVFQSVDFACDREVIVAIIATAERERNKRRFMHKNQGAFYSKMYSKMFPKTLVISRSYTHGGEKIKQTVHAPVPAALELRRAVVAKVKAHYYSCARKRCVVVFSSSFEVMMICFLL